MTETFTCLWFDHGQTTRPAHFCAQTFPDSHSGRANATRCDFPYDQNGDELTVEFSAGTRFLGLNGGPIFAPNQAGGFVVVTDTQEESDRYWNDVIEYVGARTLGAFHGRSPRNGCWI